MIWQRCRCQPCKFSNCILHRSRNLRAWLWCRGARPIKVKARDRKEVATGDGCAHFEHAGDGVAKSESKSGTARRGRCGRSNAPGTVHQPKKVLF